MISFFKRKPKKHFDIDKFNAEVAQQREKLRRAIIDENTKQILEEIEVIKKAIQNINDSLELFPDSSDRKILIGDKTILERHLKRFREMARVHIS